MKKERIKSHNSPLNFLSYLREEGPNCSPFLLSNRKDSGLSYVKAFTLVELIVVVTILAILATVGFVSYSGYLAGTRDTNRISQLKAISDGLEMYRTRHDLPMPDDYVSIEDSGAVIAYQGYVGKNVLETIEYTNEGKDPKDGSYFSYYLIKNKKYYQLMAYLEEEDSLQANIKNNVGAPSVDSLISGTVQAIDYTSRYVAVYGKKLGILTDEENTPIQELGEQTIELSGSTIEYIANFTDTSKIKLEGKKLKGILLAKADSKYFAPKDCLDGFIGVPGNPDFNQKGFCVAQYEMSWHGLTGTDNSGDWNTYSYVDNGDKGKVVSEAGNSPIGEITQPQAIEECKELGAGYHLITNAEWMTIARNIELQKENYISGGPGDGVLKNGRSNDTTMGCVGNADSNKPTASKRASVTGDDNCDGRNKLVLSNGKVIYDFAGNVWEHVNKANTIDGVGYNDGQTSVAGSSDEDGWDDDGIYDVGDMDKYGSLYHLGKNNGMGNLYYAQGRSDNVFLRGGHAATGDNAGVFTLLLDRTSGDQLRRVGFRCAK